MSGLIIDSFAGGGGASLGIEWALGRSPALTQPMTKAGPDLFEEEAA